MPSYYTPDPARAQQFARDLGGVLSDIFSASARATGQKLGVSAWEWLDEKTGEYAGTRGAEVVGMRWTGEPWKSDLVENPDSKWSITDTTQERANEMLVEAEEAGISAREFAVRMRDAGLFTEERSEMVARTEKAIAENRGQTTTFRELGFTHVDVMDGDEDDDCAEANGAVWTLEEADADPIGHPNCTRTFSPVVGEGEEEN